MKTWKMIEVVMLIDGREMMRNEVEVTKSGKWLLTTSRTFDAKTLRESKTSACGRSAARLEPIAD